MDQQAKPAAGGIGRVEIPIVRATPESLDGLGLMFDHPDDIDVEIVQWPQPGWRTMDPGTGDEAGTTEGRFEFWWGDNLLRGRNHAVDDQYIMAADADHPEAFEGAEITEPADGGSVPEAALLFHANYHPDGGQLFFPTGGGAFVAPLAPAKGDDIRLEDFTAYYFDGSKGLYIHPNVWHETMLPLQPRATFFDRQGKVHARISADFVTEFGAYLCVPLVEPA